MKNKKANKKSGNSKFYRFIYAAFGGIVRLIFRIHVVGKENEPQAGGFLVCSNHISAADPVIVSAAMQHQVCFMGKKELFKIPLLSPLLRALGAFPVDRKAGDVGAIKYSIRLLEEGKCVGLFPQGTRHPGEDPRTTSVRNGAAMIAYHANATVLPVYIYRKNNTPRLFRKTTVVIGKPVAFSSFAYDAERKGEYARIVGDIFDRICTLGEELNACDK